MRQIIVAEAFARWQIDAEAAARSLENTFRSEGIARAWASVHAASKPEQLWALYDDDHSLTVFATLEECLADRASEEHTTARVQPVCIAIATIDAESLIDRINDAGVSCFPCDFGIDEEPGEICESPTIDLAKIGEPELDELTEALSNAYAAWARKYVGFGDPNRVSIQAWNFTGPYRRFSRGTPGLIEHCGDVRMIYGPWVELCPKTIAHGVHHCTLAIDHAGDCDPELR